MKSIGRLPPNIACHVFEALAQPIVTYGSDVWGVNHKGRDKADKVFLSFARRALGVKATTCNNVVLESLVEYHRVFIVKCHHYVLPTGCTTCLPIDW